MLCATLKEEDIEELDAANRFADKIELRLDLFKPLSLERLRKKCKKPVIFKLLSIDTQVLSLNPEYVDFPYEIVKQEIPDLKRRFPKIQFIVSHHDLFQTPDLEKLYEEMKKTGADFIKIAAKANHSLDALKMLLFLKKRKCLGISIGEHGQITRILSKVFEVPWTYAPITKKHQTAEGQLTMTELREIYDFDRLSKKTQLFGLIGDPVSFSSSHLTHNYAFRELKIDAVYTKIGLRPQDLREGLHMLREIGFCGLSVTMPHKEKIAGCIKGVEKSELNSTKKLPINTLLIKNHQFLTTNTDGAAALDVIEKRMSVRGKKVVLLGAGGAALAIGKEAKSRGAQLCILNRGAQRLQSLSRSLNVPTYLLEDFKTVSKEGYDILINCTSVGMENRDLPIDSRDLIEERLVMDIISSPEKTPLLSAALKKKCEIIEGFEMFISQAALQFCFWFDR